LGLTLVRDIVQQNGGEIRVFSMPGQGTTFTIYFPQVEYSSLYTDLGASHHEEALPEKETLLLVDDEKAVRTIVRESLRLRGYEVLEAADCAEALSIAANHPGPIHLLFVDVTMPDMTGPELRDRVSALRP